MAIVKWSPLKEIEEIRKEMDRLFEEFLSPVRRRRAVSSEGIISPNVDIFEKDNELKIQIELPGVNKNEIDLTITDDRLIIKGEIKRPEGVKEEDYILSERSFGPFTRTISLPPDIDKSSVKAGLKDGLLEISIMRKSESKPREIKIQLE
ncbi:MAG: Hsp20/alpha crystallin family protein [Thermodesulfovibrio sp.]|uniref:Hsp20/alpha crystallin family protein n=1 Tax=unclassified Thermodesulfovibrio TaxID=2645936 RepID=UPI00083B25C0|nr:MULTISPECIES: Hsp20/alpha crystallin family protein [unclassified Thermodesulfovibrio]MDI1470922.1 Hsp20/alpha crystallin family protein [Thermodesulfovibrio sp. 1176]MDI6713772.1 Hsp20/alpha crystallin family protein [Thermodesulfovibrio sp.]ODA45157.1 heat shock protein Hsp20 [Thermodesulfovibrio sp. N1]